MQDTLTTKLDNIYTKLYNPTDPEPNIITFVENIVTDFAETIPSKIANAELSMYLLSRNIAFEKRKGQKITVPGR